MTENQILSPIEKAQLAYDLMRYESGYTCSANQRLTIRDKYKYSLKDGVAISEASARLDDYTQRYAKEIDVARDSCGVLMPTAFCKHSDFPDVISEGVYYSIDEMNRILAELNKRFGEGVHTNKRVVYVVKSNYNRAEILPVELAFDSAENEPSVEAALSAVAAESMKERIEDCRYAFEARACREQMKARASKKKLSKSEPDSGKHSEFVTEMLSQLLGSAELQTAVKAEIENKHKATWEKAVSDKKTKLDFEAWKKSKRLVNDCGKWNTITDIPEVAFDIAINMRHKK